MSLVQALGQQYNQNAAISNPDGVTAFSPIGIPGGTPADLGIGTMVNLVGGTASVDIPLLSIPQRSGGSLKFTFHQGSNLLEPDIVTSGGGSTPKQEDCGYNGNYLCWQEGISYYASLEDNTISHVNLPRLYASYEYYGLHASYDPQGQSPFPQILNPVYCLTNWVFVDWDGDSHPIGSGTPSVATECNDTGVAYALNGAVGAAPGQGVPKTAATSDDGLYKLDATNRCPSPTTVGCAPGSMSITDTSGTVYSFPFQSNWPSQQPGASYSGPGESIEHVYDKIFATITDRNGNQMSQVTTQDSNGASVYTIVDSSQRSFIVSPGALSYHDSQGHPQTISWSSTGGILPTSTMPMLWTDITCNVNGGTAQPPQYALTGVGHQILGPDTYYSVVYPSSAGQSSARTVTVVLDPLGNPLTVIHPEGGYTKFVYDASFSFYIAGDPLSCLNPNVRVRSKVECDSATVTSPSVLSCNHAETKTTYLPNIATGGEETSTVTVTEAAGTPFERITKHVIKPALFGLVAPGQQYYEMSESVMQGSTTVQTDASSFTRQECASWGCSTVWNLPAYPMNVTTTVNSDTGPLVKTKLFQYDYPTGGAFARKILEDDLGYDSVSIVKTVTTWESTGSYQASTRNLLSFPHTRTVTDSAGLAGAQTITYNHDDSGNLESETISGTNATTQSVNYVANGAPLDLYGRPQETRDGLGNVTQYSYADNWADVTCAPPFDSQTYLTTVTNAKNQSIVYSYDSCTGRVASVTDPNIQKTSYNYDSVGRVISTSYADGGLVQLAYVDSVPNSVQITKSQAPNASVVSKTIRDGLSRVSQTQLLSDPSGTQFVDTTYDLLGRIASVSNAYRNTGDPTYGVTQFFYDALDRKIKQVQADGSSTLWWCYVNIPDLLHPQPTNGCQSNGSAAAVASEWVDSLDETGRHWQHISDSLGRLSGVLEPNGVETDYSYDGFGNLWSVTQNGTTGEAKRRRSFIYNGLSQLVASTNPETGTICYGTWSAGNCIGGYDAAGNLGLKTDSRGVAAHYTYDSLNRLISTVYFNDAAQTPTSCFLFDGTQTSNQIGRLVREWTQPYNTSCPSTFPGSSVSVLTSTSISSYDPLGRVRITQQCVLTMCSPGGSSFQLSRDYDLAGNQRHLIQTGVGATLPHLQLSNTYDGAGRLSGVRSSWDGMSETNDPVSIFSVQSYSPAGLQSWTLGNHLKLQKTYDKRNRPMTEVVTHP